MKQRIKLGLYDDLHEVPRREETSNGDERQSGEGR